MAVKINFPKALVIITLSRVHRAVMEPLILVLESLTMIQSVSTG